MGEKVQEVICVLCPEGCRIRVTLEDDNIVAVENARCRRGADYSIQEVRSPVRDFFSTVRVCGGKMPLVSVRSTKPLPKEMLIPCASELANMVVQAPISIGDIIAENVLGLGVDLIATRDVEKA